MKPLVNYLAIRYSSSEKTISTSTGMHRDSRMNVKGIVPTIRLCLKANLHAMAILPFLLLLLCPCLCPFSRILIFPVRARFRRAQHSPAPGSTRRARELRSRSRGILHSRYRSWIKHIWRVLDMKIKQDNGTNPITLFTPKGCVK